MNIKNSKMQVLSLRGIGQLEIEERDIPVPRDDDVLVKVKNCGLCGSDIGRVTKNGTYHFPTVIGHEFSGEVVLDPEGELDGMRVSVFPLIPCFECGACKSGNYNCCKDYDYYGSRRDGGFSEYIAVKRFNLVFLPDNVTYEEGAMFEPSAVALHAVRKAEIEKGDRVLITGAGPIGLIAGRLALAFGAADVSFIEADEKKAEFLLEKGFRLFKEGEKANRAIEDTGASAVISKIPDYVVRGGTVVLMGNPQSEIKHSADEYQAFLRSELTLKGTWNSSYSEAENDWINIAEMLSDGRLVLRDIVTHRVSLASIPSVINDIASKKIFSVKVLWENDK